MPPRTRATANGTNPPSRANPTAPEVPFRRKTVMKRTTGTQFTESTPRPMYQFADNAKLLSKIRTTLGQQRLSRLPTLDELRFHLMKPDGSVDWLPLSVHIGHYIPPDEKSPYAFLPIYANINSKTWGRPDLHINGVAEEEFGDVVTHDFQGADIDWLDFFQQGEVFADHVYFRPSFVTMNSWGELLAQVCYCYLLAWEAKLPKIFWYGIPTNTEIVDVLTGLCTDKPVRNADGASGSVERSSPGVGSVKSLRLPEAGEETSNVTSSIQKHGVKRFLPEPTTPPASKRQSVQRKAALDSETDIISGAQDVPVQGEGLSSNSSAESSVVLKIRSFKPEYRQPGERAKTPPRPVYEPLSPERY